MSRKHSPDQTSTLSDAHRKRPVPELDAGDQLRIMNSVRTLVPSRAPGRDGQTSPPVPAPLVWRFAGISAISAVILVVWLSVSGTTIDQLIVQLLVNDPLLADLLAL